MDPYKTVIPRLSLDEIRNLLKYLPKPIERISLGSREQINCEIYLVKKMHNRRWENPTLLKLLIHARGSFYIYSELPPLDSYDLKSQIYLVRTCYNENVEEWVSTRFIPYSGDPQKFRDLEMFEYRGRSIEYWIKKRLLDVEKLDWDSVVGASGLCGIELFPAQGLCYTSLAFALIVRRFIEDCENQPPRYLMVQVADEFAQRVLTFRAQNQVFPPDFTLASDMLKIKRADQVRLRRDNQLIYNRPFYFLNRNALFDQLRDLIKKRILTAETFGYHMANAALADRLLNSERIAISEFSKLGLIFAASGSLYGAQITGAEIRNILRNVPDGPKLRIMKTEDFISSLQRMIDAAKAAH